MVTSRIESKHNIYKKYLNGNSRISELYTIFQDFKKLEIANYTKEIQRFTIKQNANLEKYALISKSKPLYGNYTIERLKENILKSLKYNVKYNNQTKIW